jgi:Protein of unknown function (DUF1554)/Putative Ig domain
MQKIIKNNLFIFSLVISLSLWACAQADGGGEKAAAPGISYSGSPYTFYTNVPITAQTPTLTGSTITSCAASPSLPTGLSLNSSTCEISGTASATQPATSYTITGTGSGGSGSVAISITVSSPPVPTISYSGSPFGFPMDIAISNLVPTLTGTTVTNCTVAPALPAGLSISSATCVISGTPTGSQIATTHTVTVTTAGGTNTASISIAAGKRIFVTAATTGNGNLASGYVSGIAGADARCSADANKPSTGTYKALLTDGTGSPNRRACSNANCSSGPSEGIDWVLRANTAYFRTDFTPIATTSANKIFTFSLTNAIQAGASSGQTVWLSMFGDWRSNSTVHCGQWTIGSSGDSGSIVDPTLTNSSAISGGSTTCNSTTKKLYCVEQ